MSDIGASFTVDYWRQCIQAKERIVNDIGGSFTVVTGNTVYTGQRENCVIQGEGASL